jgi:hypothetical protein
MRRSVSAFYLQFGSESGQLAKGDVTLDKSFLFIRNDRVVVRRCVALGFCGSLPEFGDPDARIMANG